MKIKIPFFSVSLLVALCFVSMGFAVDSLEADAFERKISLVNEYTQTLSDDSTSPLTVADTELGDSVAVLTLITRTIISLIAVIAAMIAVVWLLKKFGVGQNTRVSSSVMDIVEILPVGQKMSVILVRVMDKIHVLGQTPSQLTPLETIEGEKALEIISSSKGGMSVTTFKDAFNSFVSKFKKQS